jgi:hypothetical membrane protein
LTRAVFVAGSPDHGIPSVKRWLRVPSAIALLALAAGWIAGAIAQPAHFSSVTSTISDLAASYAQESEIMTAGLLVTGASLLVLVVGWSSSSWAARTVLGISGAAILIVGAAPLPTNGAVHSAAAMLAFACLTIWPLLGFRIGNGTTTRWALALLVTAVNAVFLLWLQIAPSVAIGFAERALATFSLLWVTIQTFDDTAPGSV